MWVYLWYVSYRLLFGLPESLELLAYPASKVYKVGKRDGRDRETEMGRRAKKVTGFQGPRSQDRTGQTERGVYAKEGKKKKRERREGDVVE